MGIGNCTISGFDPDVEGEQEITVSFGGKSVSFTVTVYSADNFVAVEGVSLNKTAVTIEAGGTETLAAVFDPEDASEKRVRWESDNPALAAVNVYGVINVPEDAEEGTATITVTTIDGGLTATCVVTVTTDGEPTQNLENLTVSLTAGDGLVTLAPQATAAGFAFYYNKSAASVTAPAYGAAITTITGAVAYTTATDINGPNGTAIYVQVYKVETTGSAIVGFGQAYRTPTATPDTGAPVPGGSGAITTASVTQNSLTLNWAKATDDVSATSALRYFVYQKDSAFTMSAGLPTDGTLLNTGGALDIATFNVSSLLQGTTYFFIVVVEDEAGNRAAYTAVSEITAAALTYEISASTLTSFGSLATPYTQPAAQTVIITNTGTGAVTLTQPTAVDYDIGTLSATAIAAGETATFTVQPKAGLAVGPHNETITISGSNETSATVSAELVITDPGDGSASNPFKVRNLADLQKVGTETAADGWSLSAHYEQTATINTVSINNWTPIGTGTAPFTGVYNGGGYEITNLKIDDSSGDYKGLFGHINASAALVQNVRLTNVSITGNDCVGGIVGQISNGTVQNCRVLEGSITGVLRTGGIAGAILANGVVQNCYVSGATAPTVTATGASATVNVYPGGIAGSNTGIVKNCYSTANVTGFNAGGVVGRSISGSNVVFCYATGTVEATGTGGFGGGIIGYNMNASGITTNGCVALNTSITLSNTSSATVPGRFGRIVGYIASGAVLTGGNNYAHKIMSMTVAGEIHTPTDEVTEKDGANITSAQWGAQSWYIDSSNWGGTAWNFADDWEMGTYLPILRGFAGDAQNPSLGPAGSENNPFLVANIFDLQMVSSGSTHNGGTWTRDSHYLQTANIDASSEPNWSPLGGRETTDGFAGVYDGSGYSIQNLTIYISKTSGSTSAADGSKGLFARIVAAGAVRNLALPGASIYARAQGAAAQIGGIAGRNDGTIKNCYVTGTVTGDSTVGGIAGSNYGEILNCYTTCAIDYVNPSGGSAGGIAGRIFSGGRVQYCYATGTVRGRNNVGGIAGDNQSGSYVVNCVAMNPSVTEESGSGGNGIGRVVSTNTGTGALSNNYARGAYGGGGDYLRLYQPTGTQVPATQVTGDVGLGRRQGANATADNTHGANSGTWWDSFGYSADNWDPAINRLPHLKTTRGEDFAEVQNPTATL
ncbi:MAG: Ig-like domain-containing protein [Treponema sp.]|nr:Ig-like domain-containing protein [Treponema sp.]